MLSALINQLKSRLRRKTFWWAGALVAIAISVFIAGVGTDPKLDVVKVTYGKVHHFERGFRTLSDAYDKLPDWFRRYLPYRVASALHFDEIDFESQTDLLVLWMSVKSGGGDVDSYFDVEIVDEHGCVFPSSSGDVILGGSRSASGFEFENFPRSEAILKLHYYVKKEGQITFAGEMTLVNPAYGRQKSKPLHASQLPVSARCGDAVIHLAAFDSNTFKPQFTFEENGITDSDWEINDLRYEDAEGNSAANLKEFCVREMNLKMKVKAWRYGEPLSTNEVTQATTIKVPGPGTFQWLALTNQIAGSSMQLLGVIGEGQTTFLNGIPFSPRPDFDQDFPKNPRTNTVYAKFPARNFTTIDSVREHSDSSRFNWLLTEHSSNVAQSSASSLSVEIASLKPFLMLRTSNKYGEGQTYLRLRGKKLTQIIPLLHGTETDFIPIEHFEAGEEIEISFMVSRPKEFELTFQSPFAKAQK